MIGFSIMHLFAFIQVKVKQYSFSDLINPDMAYTSTFAMKLNTVEMK